MKVFDHTMFDDTCIEQGRSKQKRKESEDMNVLLGSLAIAAILLLTVLKLM